MSIRHCVESAVSQQQISRDYADELYEIYERYRRQYALQYGDAEARRRAQEATAQRLAAEGEQRRRAALLQGEVLERIERDVFSFRNARGEIDPAAAMVALLETHGERDVGMSSGSVDGRRKAILGLAHAELEQMLHEFRRTKITGAHRNQARLENVVREAFGQDSGDQAARELAQAWGRVTEQMRQRYNEMGGAIGRREDWGLPQRHDAQALRNAGFDTWRNEIVTQLDLARMTDHLTGRPMTREELELTLRHVYDTITSEGWAHQDPTMAIRGRGALVRQHAESRFLVFKSADAWLEYQRNFGEGDPFAAMMGHINVMARDLAAMEILGPNPGATIEWLKQAVTKEAQEAGRDMPARFPRQSEVLGRELNAVDYANVQIHRAEQMWEHLRGSSSTPVSSTLANTVAGARNIVTGAALGSAALSAVTDVGFQNAARKFAGAVGTGTLRILGDMVAQLRSMNRREAVRAGLILDHAVHVMHEQARYVGTFSGPAWTGYVADRVLTYSGLTPWTQMGKHSFGMWFMGELADQVGAGWNALGDVHRRTLQRYGLGEGEWEFMRRAELHDLSADGSGAGILRANEIATLNPRRMRVNWRNEGAARRAIADGARLTAAEADAYFLAMPTEADFDLIATATPKVQRYTRGLAERYLEMILQETTYAVPEATVKARTMLRGETRPGTVLGELIRSAAQFKSFGVAVAIMHGGRIGTELAAGRTAGGARYAAALAISTTILGALAMQMKAVSRGEDPRPMDDPKFWLAAMAQGGGWGIWGDFFLAEQNRFGGGWATTMAGPLVGRLENAWNLTAGNVRKLTIGEKTNFGRELTQFIKNNTPGSSIWYARLAWERILLDSLQRVVDPEAQDAFRRRAATARRDRRTQFYWGPGQRGPARAPSLGNVAGN